MVLYSLLNRGIWFSHKPFHNMNSTKFCLGLHWYILMSHQQIANLYLMSVCYLMSACFPMINSMKVFAASISICLPYFRAGIFVLGKTSPEMFWFKDHILTISPLLVISVTTSWAFEAVIRHLRYSSQCLFSLCPIVSFSMVSIFSLLKTFKTSPLKKLIFLDILMTSDMLRTFSDWTIFVQRSYRTKSSFGVGTGVCNIIWGETLLIASAKSFINNGFKSQFFRGSNLFFGEATKGLFFSSLAKNLLTEI